MIQMSMREEHSIDRAGIEGERGPVSESKLFETLKKPTIDEQRLAGQIHQILRPRHRLGRTSKRNVHEGSNTAIPKPSRSFRPCLDMQTLRHDESTRPDANPVFDAIAGMNHHDGTLRETRNDLEVGFAAVPDFTGTSRAVPPSTANTAHPSPLTEECALRRPENVR